MKLLVIAAVLLASPAALACDLNLVAPAKSALKQPVRARISLEGDTLVADFSVSAPLNARKVLGPHQYPYMFDVVELFLTFSESGFPYYEFEVSPYNQTFQVNIVSRARHVEGVRLGLVSTAKIAPGGWTAEMKIPLRTLGWDGDHGKIRGNLYSVLERSPRSYWSSFLPRSGKPNFHQPQFFRPLLQCGQVRGTRMQRRDFLKLSGGLSAYLVVGGSPPAIQKAEAQSGLPVAELKAALDPKKDVVLLHGDSAAAKKDVSFNKRTQIAPKVRVIAGSPAAVGSTILWATRNGVKFAIRSGGHSYEGLSQSPDLVIDVRGMAAIRLAADRKSVWVGSGASLGSVYHALGPAHLAIPAGSCFPVGVAGHSLGGGFGLLGRAFGLACDSILSMQMVDATGKILDVSAQDNPDLFWALRGGGNGNFGVVTGFNFRTSAVNMVAKFGVTWDDRSVAQATKIVRAWQDWLEELPSAISFTLHLGQAGGGLIRVRLAGLSVGSLTALKTELKRLQTLAGTASSVTTSVKTFAAAAVDFNGGAGAPAYESVFQKAKSDYVVDALSEQGIQTLLDGLKKAASPIAVLFDGYGGEINKIAPDATAFVHRGKTRYSIQYTREWSNAGSTNANVALMRNLYNPMRPFVSGGAYVNYCDLDLGDAYARAYWGDNLPRLISIKAQVDPGNVFRHAQSIPVS
jgi:FAD/FMN-containing dehydrogenase